MSFLKHFASAVLLLIVSSAAWGQTTAIKTNILYDATANANLAIETAVGKLWTIELLGNLNAWKFSDNKQWRNYVIQPEIRRWLCTRYNGHFFAAHALAGEYNIGNVDMDFKFLGTDFSKLKDSRFQGWMVGAGIAYGYDWILARHWNLEAEIGIGWVYSQYDRYPCAHCGNKLESKRSHNYFGPTKAAINIVYEF